MLGYSERGFAYKEYVGNKDNSANISNTSFSEKSKDEEERDLCRNIFGRVLSKARRSRNLSVEDLARMLDCDKKTVIRWERGEHEPRFFMIYRLARVLEYPVTFFFAEMHRHLEGIDIVND